MPKGWGDIELWNKFRGINRGGEVMAILKERGENITFCQFLRIKIQEIYMHHLGSMEAVEQYWIDWEGLGYPDLNLNTWG